MKTITDVFVDYLYKMSRSPFSDEIKEQARLCLIDYKVVTIAGAQLNSAKEKVFLNNAASQGGEVSIVGRTEKTTMQNAAFLNAMNAHVAELDDGHRQGQIHLGASIISALLPVAEVEGLSDDDILRGIIIGYEAAIRLAMTINPAHKLRGYHTSGTCGAIGTAMSIAAALCYDRNQMKNALSAATASAAGILEMQEDESELKPYNLAQAAIGGITAAYCARAGFKGPDDALGGKRGFLSVMTENPQLQFVTEFKEPYGYIETVYRKPYAACRHAHSAIEAALIIKKDFKLDFHLISRIRIETYGMAIRGHDHVSVKSIPSAKMSIPFSVALALVKGSAGLKDYSRESLRDPRILALSSRVEMVESSELSSLLPHKRAAKVSITVPGGRYEKQVDYPKGEPENPMSENEIIKKTE